MNIIFRKGTPDDLDEIAEFIIDATEKLKNSGINQWDDIYPVQEDFNEDINNNQLYVGMRNNDIAVVFTLNKEFDEQYANGKWKEPQKEFYVIHRLCVNPKFQKQGIAGKTMKFIDEECKRLGAEAVRLDVYCKNPHAISLYKKCGYQQVGTVNWRKGVFNLMEKYL